MDNEIEAIANYNGDPCIFPDITLIRKMINIYSIQDSNLMRMRAVFQNETSVIVGISISGGGKDMLYLLRESHKSGAKTILITARNRGDHEEFCDELLLVPALRYLENGNVISPQFPVLVMLDVLYAYYVEQDKSRKEIWRGDTLKALKVEKRQLK